MSQIRILPENIANQIAAGEVVERPASVVKELVENALDAGARSIDVQVEGDGARLIRVIDDGRGMDEDDMLLCLERHATSKIRQASDLAAIRTLGFRGEAMPSIASISRMTITSRVSGCPLGGRVEVRFGKVVKVHEMGCAFGTIVEVRQLFGNVPARRKFLKSARTELAHIDEVLTNFCLVHPDKGFSFTVDGRSLHQLPPDVDTLASRMQRLASSRDGQPLIAIGGDGGPPEATTALRIGGYLFAPDDSGWRGNKLRLFINGRTVKDRMLAQAVIEGGEGFYMKGRRPAGVILVDIDPAAVDVNVHPTKQEVRFHRPSQVFSAVSVAVRQGLNGFQRQLGKYLFGLRKSQQPDGDISGLRSKPTTTDQALPIQSKDSRETPVAVSERLPLSPAAGDNRPVLPESGRYLEKRRSPQSTYADTPLAACNTAEVPAAREPHVSLRLIGQLHNSYLLCEDQESLLVIDQHAAQERLLYERMLRQYEDGKPAKQTLLFPAIVELNAEELQLIEYFSKIIAGLGFELQPFGGESMLIKAVPALLSGVEPESLLRGLLERFSEQGRGKGRKGADRIEEVIAQMACKAAVKARHRLLPEEMDSLLHQMKEADVFSHCPHGRPVVRRFSKTDIEKWFFRT